VVLNASFGGIGDAIFNDESTFSSGFVKILAKYVSVHFQEAQAWLLETATTTRPRLPCVT
jgi:hypothetical protein